MKMRTPVTGALIDVEEERAAYFAARGFQRVEEPKKKPAPKKKKEAEEE